MNPKRSPKVVWAALAIGAASDAAAFAAPPTPARPRPTEVTRLAQAPEPGPQRPGIGGRTGPGGPAFERPLARPRPWSEVPEPERRQIERFMEEHFPRMYVEMQRLKDRDEIRHTRQMTRIAPQMRQIMEAIRKDPQRGALMIRERQVEFEIRQMVARYQRAEDDAAKRRIRAQLEEVCGRGFDIRHERRQIEVRELQARLSELQARLSESEKMRPALIRQRVSELLERPVPKPVDEEDDRKVPADGGESESE